MHVSIIVTAWEVYSASGSWFTLRSHLASFALSFLLPTLVLGDHLAGALKSFTDQETILLVHFESISNAVLHNFTFGGTVKHVR